MMKKKVLYISLLVTQAIIVCFFSVTKIGWDFIKDIVLEIVILDVIITGVVIYLEKKSSDSLTKNEAMLMTIVLIVLTILRIVIIGYESIYTNKQAKDIENMYSSSFLDNINSYDELYDALNITNREREIITNDMDCVENWTKELKKNPINYIRKYTPLVERFSISYSRILYLSWINSANITYRGSFSKYKEVYTNAEDKKAVKGIKKDQKEYIQHLIVLFIITTIFESIWLLLMIKIKK